MSEARTNPRIERVNEIEAEIQALRAERRQIYRESLEETDEALKVCADSTARAMSENDPEYEQYAARIDGALFDVPWSVKQVLWDDSRLFANRAALGRYKGETFVKIRSVREEHGEKTFFGVLIGEMATSLSLRVSDEGILGIEFARSNPLIYVPELGDVLFGFESWWGEIKTVEELNNVITDETINSIWYVRAMKALTGQEPDVVDEAKKVIEAANREEEE